MGGLVLLGCFNDTLQLFRSLGPDKRRAMLVVMVNVVQQEILELTCRPMDAVRQPLAGENAEETLDQIQPGGVRRDVVEMHTRVPL